MDTLANVGAWILSEGANNTAIYYLSPEQQVEPPPERHTWTVYEQQSVDHLFATEARQDEASLSQALLVTTVGMAALKGVVLDESKDEEDEATKKQKLKIQHKCGGCC